MVTSNNAGSESSSEQHIRHLDVFRPEFANDVAQFAYARPGAFEELVKAIAPRNVSIQNSILRYWGIRG